MSTGEQGLAESFRVVRLEKLFVDVVDDGFAILRVKQVFRGGSGRRRGLSNGESDRGAEGVGGGLGGRGCNEMEGRVSFVPYSESIELRAITETHLRWPLPRPGPPYGRIVMSNSLQTGVT